MEPDDMPFHDLLGVGDQAEPGPDPLRAIVARARRRRLRVAAGGMVVALAAGGAIGYGLSNRSSPASQTSTVSAPAASGSGSGSAASTSSGPSTGGVAVAGAPGLLGLNGRLTPLFTRTTDGGVTVRAFRTGTAAPAALPRGCAVSVPRVQVEVSTAAMVGITVGSAPATHAQPVTAVDSEVVGQPEGDPTAVIMVATGPTVSRVQVSFKERGMDSMTPSGGWAVLAGAAPAYPTVGVALGTLTALNAAGHVVSSSALTLNSYQPLTVTGGSCAFPCPQPASGTASGSGTARPAVVCAAPASPCGRVVPGRVQPTGGTMPPLRPGGVFACAGGSGSAGGASSGSASNTGTGAAG